MKFKKYSFKEWKESKHNYREPENKKSWLWIELNGLVRLFTFFHYTLDDCFEKENNNN